MTSLTTCPVAHDFDPLEKSFLTDPFPRLAELREEGPVFFQEE
ncbi:MAG: hypothetical protein JWL64_1678, partial [Frankiales bacterium]|nr:hypothetical protein [Frankiales bacterium]